MQLSYKKLDGYHCFSSDNKYARGMLVLSKNIIICFKDIKLQLEFLLKFNYKKKLISVEFECTPEAFLKSKKSTLLIKVKVNGKEGVEIL